MNAIRRSTSLQVLLLLALALGLTSSPAGATHVSPVFVAGNPSCATLNADNANFPSITSDFGFKLNGASSGTFTFTNPPGELTGGAPSDPNNSVTISNVQDLGLGPIFDWAATLGIDAVIVKGGPNANAYVYDPEALADQDLHAPVNPMNYKFFGISHIEFCYDYEVQISKTADTSFTRTFDWTIEKSVSPEVWDLFTGDSGTSEYTVEVTKSAGTDSDWAVEGAITIHNPHPTLTATITDVSDAVSGLGSVPVSCGVMFPHSLAPGATMECTYSAGLPDGANRTNTATVTTSGSIGGGQASADVTFGAPTVLVNDSINVDDSLAGDLGTFSADGSAIYERTFTCDADEGIHDNTATIVETGQSDDASVTVNCYELEVTKNADEEFDRTWEWTIDKSADQSNLLLTEGQLFQVNYAVTVDASPADSDWMVSGDIWVSNPNPELDASLTAVSDLISPSIAATVDCPSLTVPADGSLHCTYQATLPDGSNRTNTATATLQNNDYDEEGQPTPAGTTDFSGSADVNFAIPTVESDECADISDSNIGFLGTVCAGDAPSTFNYSLMFGAQPDADVILQCGENTHTNIASFVTNDSGATGEESWTVNANVACALGCTLTPGYWKTHSEFGPAPFDDTWSLLPNGASTAFFLSGQSYYQVLWTSPQGNAYYILAHAYIATELNQLNGASVPPEVLTAFNEATDLLNTYTPAEIGALKGNNPLRKQFLALAGILDGYNNGVIGPGHCSE